MKISELKPNDQINSIYILKRLDVRDAKTGKKYADFDIKDRTGEINCKIWDISNMNIDSFKSGDYVLISGSVELYNTRKQVRVVSMSLAHPTDEIIASLVESAPVDSNQMYDYILSTIENEVVNEDIRKITLAILEAKKDKLLYYPAAKSFHHAIKGGLLYHTTTMLRNAKNLCKVYTYLNTDLVYAGVVLHDLGKVEEMNSDDKGVVSGYTKEGMLLGHIITGICDIDSYAKRLGITGEVPLLLKHIILSHHLQPEFGSPKPPMIPEGELIHYLDELDARMYQMEKTVQNMENDSFIDRVWVLDNRTMYKPDLETEKEF